MENSKPSHNSFAKFSSKLSILKPNYCFVLVGNFYPCHLNKLRMLDLAK